jgi:hypothetical protein
MRKIVLLAAQFLLFFVATAQPKKPIIVLQPSAMSHTSGNGNAFGFNNDYYVFNTNGYIGDSVYFPEQSVYRFDVSAWSNFSHKEWSNLQIRIDGTPVALINVNQKVLTVFSVLSSPITAGSHMVTIHLINHSSLTNVTLKLGLCYITKDNIVDKILLPTVIKTPPNKDSFFTVNNYMSGKVRGFNEGSEGTYHPVIESNYRDGASLGANLFRHHFTIILNPINDTYSLENGDVNRFDSMLAWAEKYNFYVNIGFDQDPHAQDQLWWGNSKREQSISSLWKFVANRYKNNKRVASYSLINEPTPAGRVGEYINWTLSMVDSIRAGGDSVHCIVFPWAHDMSILKMMMPLPYANVMYEYHFYDPFEITSQGINGFTQSNKYPSASYTINDLKFKLAPLNSFDSTWNASMYISEFGCVRYAPRNASGESSSDRWYADCISIFEAAGYPWTVTSWRQSEIWDIEISSWRFYKCSYKYAEPTCNFGQFDAYRTDTTRAMLSLRNALNKNK